MSILISQIPPNVWEWCGCGTGVTGSALLALNRPKSSGLGFVCFLASNGFWSAYALSTGAHGLLAQQSVFTATSLLGVWRWIVVPHQARANASNVNATR
jgi:hypothetical protein